MGWLVKGIFRYISGIFHSIFRFFLRYISGIFRVRTDFVKVYFGIFRVYFIVYFGVCRGIFQWGMGKLAPKRGCQHEIFHPGQTKVPTTRCLMSNAGVHARARCVCVKFCVRARCAYAHYERILLRGCGTCLRLRVLRVFVGACKWNSAHAPRRGLRSQGPCARAPVHQIRATQLVFMRAPQCKTLLRNIPRNIPEIYPIPKLPKYTRNMPMKYTPCSG